MHAARIAVSYHELPLLSQFQVFTTSLLKQHVVVVVVVIIIRRMHRSLELLYFSVWGAFLPVLCPVQTIHWHNYYHYWEFCMSRREALSMVYVDVVGVRHHAMHGWWLVHGPPLHCRYVERYHRERFNRYVSFLLKEIFLSILSWNFSPVSHNLLCVDPKYETYLCTLSKQGTMKMRK